MSGSRAPPIVITDLKSDSPILESPTNCRTSLCLKSLHLPNGAGNHYLNHGKDICQALPGT